MKICILTIGTRGDVQPYVALGQGLKAAGHAVSIATQSEFEALVNQHGLVHKTLRGDYLNAAQSLSDSQGIINPLKMIQRYKEFARDTLEDEWSSAQDCELLIFNPAAIGGYHIAEKLAIPSFSAFPAPLYSPTREFPSPFFPFQNLGPFNKLSHHIFAKMGPSIYRSVINEWRSKALGLPPAKGEAILHGKPVTRLYAYSTAVLPRPTDWDESAVVTGYWFLDAPGAWQPDPALVQFLEAGPPPVYIGFGSMFMRSGSQTTELVLEALKIAGLRGILATGWGRLTAHDTTTDIFVTDDVPHDWLFPKVAAIVHHGGAGTTGAALRAGKPMVVCPFVGDQTFWGRRMAALGVSPQPIPQPKLTAGQLAEAIRAVVEDGGIRQRAVDLGEVIRAENGVERAVAYILQR